MKSNGTLGPLHKSPPARVRHELIQRLWNESPQRTFREPDVRPFFEYYTRECRLALLNQGSHTSVRDHHDVIELAQQIKAGKTRQEMVAHLNRKATGLLAAPVTESFHGSINLTARLVSMVDIGALELRVTERIHLDWAAGSLKDFIHAYFNEPCKLEQEAVRLEKMFTARNLTRLAGIEIVLTDNLADHLRMVGGEDKKVAIFHHAFFLKNNHGYIYRKSHYLEVRRIANSCIRDLFPDDFLKETLSTLALLFPQCDGDIAKWVRRLPIAAQMDLTCFYAVISRPMTARSPNSSFGVTVWWC